MPELDDVSEGLVISDVANDTENQGNQFVWVPVTDITKFVLKDGYAQNNLQTYVSSGNSKEPLTTGGYSTEVEEYEEMKESVRQNKGFYIGRYEVGKENEKAVVKKDKEVYIGLKWGNSMTDNSGGAVELARNFAKENGYTKVTSTLCYGVQWDATMQFMDNNYINGTCDENSYIRNSTGKGNYDTLVLINTGSNENYKIKNIYDMAGNAEEWTMEANYDDYRVFRSGPTNGGYYSPMSVRAVVEPDQPYFSNGLRITLYL